MDSKDMFFELPAVRGTQAGKSYYTVMCPLHMVSKFFTYTDISLPPEMRLQRVLNRQRIPEMRDYILRNRDNYIFSALTASIDGELEFLSTRNSSSGQLKIPMNARILINDGQHRRAAIEAALLESSELRYEDIAIVIYSDLGLSRSQQMFSDLNRYAVRPTKSLNILYDNRDSFSLLIKECITHIPMFFGSVENEKSTISNRSKALFTLSGIFHASKLLLLAGQYSNKEAHDTIVSFWNAVAVNMPLWQRAKNKQLLPLEFRKEYICAHAIALKALGQVGNILLIQEVSKTQWIDKLHFLQDINWSKNCSDLQGLVIINDRISSSQSNQSEFAKYLIEKSGWTNNSERGSV